MDDFLNYVKGIFDRSRGLFTLGFATIVSNGIGGLFWLYIASLLGTEDYGRVSYFISIAIIPKIKHPYNSKHSSGEICSPSATENGSSLMNLTHRFNIEIT